IGASPGCSLRLPERDLPSRGSAHNAAPAVRALAGLEQHLCSEVPGPIGRLADLRHLHVRQPEGAARATLDDPTPAPAAELQGEIRAPIRLDSLRGPAAEVRVQVAGPRKLPRVQLQMDDSLTADRHHLRSTLLALVDQAVGADFVELGDHWRLV